MTILPFIAALLLIFTACMQSTSQSAIALEKGSVNVAEKGGIKIHTYMSDKLQATHIIESKNSLVLVDSQFFASFAKEFRAYADSLNKPIERVIISHSHPDHFLGLGAGFADVKDKIYALSGTKAFSDKAGPGMFKNMKKRLGDALADQFVGPSQVLKTGTTKIDGITYEFKELKDGEAGQQLLIKLPDLNTLIVQDLVYNNLHSYLANNTFDNWIAILESLQNLAGYDTVLPGHGKPADINVLASQIAYLKDAKTILAEVDNGKAFKARIMKKYPNLAGENYIDISLYGLFPNQ